MELFWWLKRSKSFCFGKASDSMRVKFYEILSTKWVSKKKVLINQQPASFFNDQLCPFWYVVRINVALGFHDDLLHNPRSGKSGRGGSNLPSPQLTWLDQGNQTNKVEFTLCGHLVVTSSSSVLVVYTIIVINKDSKFFGSGSGKWVWNDSAGLEAVAREGCHHREWWAGVFVGGTVQRIESHPLWPPATAEIQDSWFSKFDDRWYSLQVSHSLLLFVSNS